ncbi:WD40 repeat-like protein [Testicularia cyperi]|uniref:WD40 repeat-like protein n=1 Tax=Testicularia cyperi TaxID=1882483 RepID=A0A317XEW2_9BASI|nr:WD40 repeat-like protein [Testicularia cyperi]
MAMDLDPSQAEPAALDQPGLATTNPENASSASQQFDYELVYSLQGHQKGISSVAISPSGLLLATASADASLKIWSLELGSLLHTFTGHAGGINDVSWSADSIYIATCSDDKSIRVFNILTKQQVRHFAEHTSYVLCLSYNVQSTLLVSGSFDETVRLWNVARNKCHRVIMAHSEAVSAVDFNRDGTMIVSASYDGLIRLWDTTTGQCLKTLVHKDQSPIGFVKFSPSSAQLLCSSLDSTIRLWDIYNTKIVKTYLGHTNTKFAINAALVLANPGADNVDANSQLLVASGSEDHKVYFWNLQTKEIVATIPAHKDTVISVDLHPTLPIIATGALEHDHTVKVWFRRPHTREQE